MKLELHSVTFFSISKLRQNSTILLRFLLQFKYKYLHLKTKAKNLPKTNTKPHKNQSWLYKKEAKQIKEKISK